MDTPRALAIVIAAGGEGRRMGGAKPLREFAGRPLVDHACAFALRQSSICAIAVREAGQVAASALATPLPLLVDNQPGLGPVSALLSAMRFARTNACEAVMLIGCDQPFLPHDLLATLAGQLGACAVAMPVSGGKDQPLASLWRLNEAEVERFIARGGRSLWRLADHLGAVRVAWPSSDPKADPFANINDPASLSQLAAALPEKGATPCA